MLTGLLLALTVASQHGQKRINAETMSCSLQALSTPKKPLGSRCAARKGQRATWTAQSPSAAQRVSARHQREAPCTVWHVTAPHLMGSVIAAGFVVVIRRYRLAENQARLVSNQTTQFDVPQFAAHVSYCLQPSWTCTANAARVKSVSAAAPAVCVPAMTSLLLASMIVELQPSTAHTFALHLAQRVFCRATPCSCVQRCAPQSTRACAAPCLPSAATASMSLATTTTSAAQPVS